MSEIKEGETIVVQRQNTTQLFKLKGNKECRLGRDVINLSAVVGEKYWTTFKMVPSNNAKKFTLLKTDNLPDILGKWWQSY